MRALLVLCAAALMIAGPGCSKRSSTRTNAKFRHGTLPSAWEPTTMEGLAAAWYHAERGSTVGIAVVCDEEVGDVSVGALAQRELVGIERRVILEQTTIPVDGRDAEDWVVKGSVDGVEVRLNLVVLRKDRCVYDLNLISRPESFEDSRVDFREFVTGFAVLE